MSQIVIPAMGESVSEGTISAWLKRDGEYVENGEPLFELETDKITTEVPAPASGVLKIRVDEGATVEVGSVVGELTEGSAQPTKSKKKSKAAPEEKPATGSGATFKAVQSKPVQPPPAITTASQVKASPSPAVRRLLSEHNLNIDEVLSSVAGSGKDGRITKEDVEQYLAGRQQAPQQKARVETTLTEGHSERQRMSTLRQKIAQRLVQAQHEAAILTTFNEIDMSTVMNLRKQYQDSFQERHGIKLGVMSFFVKAVVSALQAWPQLNSFIDGNDIIVNNFFNIGVAVSTERGLMVPVIRDADRLSFADIEREIGSFAERARNNSIRIEDLQGGTFTISNGGVFGSLMATPILNPPQSGILGMHAIQKRPVVIDDQIVIRPMMYIALSYDHRIVDGRESVSFLKHVKQGIENPVQSLFDL